MGSFFPTACLIRPGGSPALDLRDTCGTVSDPELDQPSNSRNRQQTSSGREPSANAPPLEPSCDRSDYSPGSGDWSDDVANPVDEVQECTFWLSTGLALHGHIRLRRAT